MDNKTNDERLKILQERLAQLKQKEENHFSPKEETYSPAHQDNIKVSPEKEEIKEEKVPKWGLEEKNKRSFGWVKYIIVFGIIGLAQYYWQWDISNIIKSSNEKEEVIIPKSEEKLTEIKYSFNLNGENIAITASFINEESAKALVNNLRVKGFQSNYFFLPDKSNSNQKIYKVFIGPYENIKETNQWCKNLENDFEIINL